MRASDLIRELQAEIGVYGDREVLIEYDMGAENYLVCVDAIDRIKVDGESFLLSSVL